MNEYASNIDSEMVIENIKTTMAIEKHFLSNDDIQMLKRYANNEISMDDAINNIKTDISSRMV